jgi:replicative DNA helicase
MPENGILEMVESVYNRNYKYGCQDTIMKQHCKTQCVHFNRKDYLVDIKSASEMQDELMERLTTDFSGKTIDLGKSLGIDKESIIYPGELVTIFGPTGSNKTTFAQNLALGVDFENNKINKDWQIPTLFLSLELSSWYMHRRHLQIVSNKTKEEVNSNYKNLYEANKDKLEHIMVQTISPTLDKIYEKIRELQPQLVIVDYIDLVDTPMSYRGEYEKIKYISHGLSNMAVNNDLIVIQISQVSREYSRNEVLDLYAGKGSGAIENASRKVIGLNGQSDSSTRAVRLFKNTDGELFDTEVEWTPSFRLRRTNGKDSANISA